MITGALNSISLATIRIFPSLPGGTGSFDITKRPKNWVGSGDLTKYLVAPGYYLFDVVSLDANNLPYLDKLLLSAGDVFLSNCDVGVTFSGGAKPLQEIPYPVDLSKIPDGYSLGTNLLGVASLVSPNAPPSTGGGLPGDLITRLQNLCTKFGV